MMRRIAILAAAAALFAAPQAHAQDEGGSQDLKGVWFAGGSVGDSTSGYGGVVYALPGARLGKGLALRGSVNAGSYDYLSGVQQIEGDYVGGEVALLYQVSGQWGWANFSAGPRFTHTTLDPVDPTNAREGSRWDIGLQTDGAFDGRAWRLGWLGSFGAIDEEYEARVDVAHKFGGGRYRIGAEFGITGDPAYEKQRVGGFVALPLAGRAEIQLGAGASFQDGEDAKAYGSLGISSVF